MTSPATHPPVIGRDGVPSLVHRLNPLVHRLLRLGVPMGSNVLLTVRGRKTGQPHEFPVAVLEAGDRMFLFSPFGEVNWVHNLRAAGTATIRRGRQQDTVAASPVPPDQAAEHLETGLRPILSVPVFGSMICGWYGIDRTSTKADYLAAARRHPAFELRRVG